MTALTVALLLALALTIGLIAVTAYGYRIERREVTRLRAQARSDARDDTTTTTTRPTRTEEGEDRP